MTAGLSEASRARSLVDITSLIFTLMYKIFSFRACSTIYLFRITSICCCLNARIMLGFFFPSQIGISVLRIYRSSITFVISWWVSRWKVEFEELIISQISWGESLVILHKGQRKKYRLASIAWHQVNKAFWKWKRHICCVAGQKSVTARFKPDSSHESLHLLQKCW